MTLLEVLLVMVWVDGVLAEEETVVGVLELAPVPESVED